MTKEKAMYMAGVYEGMKRLADTMSGSNAYSAQNLISTAYYNFLKEQEEITNNSNHHLE